MQIYVHKNNQQLGPFTEAEIKAQLASGAITLEDHVWWQGQANWLPLGQTSLVTPGAAPLPAMPGAPLAAEAAYSTPARTSQLAIWALVCGCLCLTLICSSIFCIPAIILGHLALSAIKRNPGLQGRGLAIGGMILGYFFALLVIASWVILAALGNQVKDIYKTLNAQMAAAQAANNSDQSTNSEQPTNAPDQTTPSATPTNSPDQSTNSATATPPKSDSNTNAPTSPPTVQ